MKTFVVLVFLAGVYVHIACVCVSGHEWLRQWLRDRRIQSVHTGQLNRHIHAILHIFSTLTPGGDGGGVTGV